MMRALLVSFVAGAFAVAAQAQTPPDKALVGTWTGAGQVATAAMARTGGFILHIDAGGFYLQVFRSPQDFIVDWGDIYLGKGEFWRRTSTGLEDRGGYARTGDGFTFTGTWSRYTLTPAADAEAARLRQVAAAMKTRPEPTVDAWKARAAALAPLWQVDATLDRVTLDRPSADGSLGPQNGVALTFVSPGAGRALTLRSTPAGGFASAVTPLP